MSAAVEMLPFPRRLCRDPSKPKPRACRNLFGTPDKEEIDRLLQTELSKYEEEDREKYNFDFHSDCPFEGKYEWETCDPHDIPAIYRPVTVLQGKRLPQTPNMASDHGDASNWPVQSTSTSTSVDVNLCGFIPSGLHTRLHGFSSNPEKAITHRSHSNTRTQVEEPKTSESSVSCAIGLSSAKSVKRPTHRPAVSTRISKANQPKITDFLQQRKRPVEALSTNKRRKVDCEHGKYSRTTPATAETSSS
ncbi:uncharacterized protein [Amphiura filiformis]|uniref:uncharacterized protein n=1 Tax=Amphiura filiformis TaxID=82378 RepID=UPI003B228C28